LKVGPLLLAEALALADGLLQWTAGPGGRPVGQGRIGPGLTLVTDF
jgi:hypothetical protein